MKENASSREKFQKKSIKAESEKLKKEEKNKQKISKWSAGKTQR